VYNAVRWQQTVQALYDSIKLPAGSGLDPGAVSLTDKAVGTLDALAMYCSASGSSSGAALNSDDDCSGDSDNDGGDAPDDVFDDDDDVSTMSESGESILTKVQTLALSSARKQSAWVSGNSDSQ
jgi:hypothetical protein